MPDVETYDSTIKQYDDERYSYFVWQVMSDVYALVDYLSGRARPSLATPQYRRQTDQTARLCTDTTGPVTASFGPAERDTIEADLEHPISMIQRAMQIGKTLHSGDISANDAAFLVSARDLLNLRAAPATGQSIVFTLLVISKIHPRAGVKEAGNSSNFLHANESLESAATKMASFVRRSLWAMILLLSLALLLSAYVAWGKLLLDTRDAVLRDLGANEAVFAAQLAEGPSKVPLTGNLVSAICQSDHHSFTTDQACRQNVQVNQRLLNDVIAHIQSWDLFPRESPEGVVQHAVIIVGVLGNYLLPVLYGALGAMGSMLRYFNRRLAERLLTPRDRRGAHIRVMLGVMTGGCIGLFFNSSAGPAQATGLGGAAVTLSASAIAFLAGYGVDAVFKMMDALIGHLFRSNNETIGTAQSRQHATDAAA